MKKLLLAAAAVAAVTTGSAAALASSAGPVVHHARCTQTAVPGAIACDMRFAMGHRPGDVRVVIRTPDHQRVGGIWVISCRGWAVAAGDMKGRTTVRKHLLGQVKASGRCRMAAGVNLSKTGTVTLVFSWVSR